MNNQFKEQLDKLAAVATMAGLTLADYAHTYLGVPPADSKNHQWTWANLIDAVILDADRMNRMEQHAAFPEQAANYRAMREKLNNIRADSMTAMPKEVYDNWFETSPVMEESRRKAKDYEEEHRRRSEVYPYL